MEILNTILEWPIIVQGALGSALFWLILVAGQKLTALISSKIGEDKDVATTFCLLAKAGPTENSRLQGYLNTLYGGFHYFIKALIVVVISLLTSPINHIVAMVGYFISVYFLFRSLFYVQHFTALGTTKECEEKLKKIGFMYPKKETANNQVNKDASR